MSIKRALVSVYDKSGLIPFAKSLVDHGVTLLSTGGTQKAIAEAGLPVVGVEEYTGSPEVMGGRVKTLHPRVHGGLLARSGLDDADLVRLGAELIDLVVVNLYPFEATRARAGVTHDEIVEMIDIGGPSMLRSAAKNHARVTALVDPADYHEVEAALAAGRDVPAATRARLAAKVFAHTAAYDATIAEYLSSADEGGEVPGVARHRAFALDLAYPLRYGENPHQRGAFYRDRDAALGSLARAESLGAGGRELSFNNLVDAHAALDAVREFDEPTAVVVKHTNPCGVATSSSLADAYRAAREADATSAFGGIVALNREVDDAAADVLVETFLECVIAPSFSPGALERLRAKKNLRLLAVGHLPAANAPGVDVKRVAGGFVVQDRDASAAGEVAGGRVVSARQPSDQEIADLEFAWRVCKHAKSNAIVIASGARTLGVGAGQMSRVQSVRIACEKAGDEAKGAALASDAFFPFADGVEEALARGIRAFAQPGGSVRDADVIAAVDRAGAAMVFTGVRHFRH